MTKYEHSVAVLIETVDTWGRNIVETVARFAQKHRWSLVIAPRDGEGRLRLPKKWNGDGAIVMLRDAATVRHIRQAGIPAVDVDVLMQHETWVGRVVTDDSARVQMALDHFRSRGLEHFAYYAPPINRYPDQRSRMFQQVVEKAGYRCSGFNDFDQRDLSWHVDYEKVARWIASLPSPLAVFSPDPFSARQLTEICQWERIRIPDQVAVLAGDTDELLCRIASPPISSIELDCPTIATEACKLLARMMKGGRVPRRPKRIPPLRVITRHSTETLAIDDPQIADVLRFIRSHACEGIRVGDILRVFPISRRSLEQKFRDTLGRTLAEEIRRTRLEKARTLLLETDSPVAAIATACSFSSGGELSHAFRKYWGIRPTDLRDGGPAAAQKPKVIAQ